MRFRRLTVRNFRGVEEASVDFAPDGITLVQGRNEAGKSSLAEALSVLFTFKASSKAEKVRLLKPVHRDAGPFVELEAESGGYDFVYAKQFLKGSAATLTIRAPAPENHTGDAAHERMERILAETLDRELWQALIVAQGGGLDLPDLKRAGALMQALDAAAGGCGDDAGSEDIFERVAAAYGRYHTATGREGKDLVQARTQRDETAARAAALEAQLRDLDAKTERSAALRRERARIESDLDARSKELEERRKVMADLGKLEQARREARLRLETADATAEAAHAAWQARHRLLAAVDAARAEVERLAALPDDDARLDLDDRLRRCDAACAEAAERRRAADAALARARADCDRLRDRDRLATLRARAARLAEARARAAAAVAELEANRVDAALLDRVKEADLALARCTARLDAQSPRVALTGLAALRLGVDGEDVELGEGERREFAVSGALSVVLPGALRLDVDAGEAVEAERDKVHAARERLEGLLAEAGTASVADAIAAAARRREAEGALAEARRRLEAEGGGDDPEAQARALEAALALDDANRGDAPEPASLDDALACRARAETALDDAAQALDAATTERETLRRLRDAAVASEGERRVGREMAARGLAQAERELAEARVGNPDDALAAARTGAEREAAARRLAAEEADAAWADRNPDRERTLLETAEGNVVRLRTRLQDIEHDATALATELRVRGEEGLYEQAQAAREEADAAAGALAALEAKAAAARLLYETMRAARDAARRSYVKPLKDTVDELGRWVFDADFAVEMDEAGLAVAARTLGGVTVPFASLSGGAREQVSLIFRAACAILVSPRQGMPLILDDALGFTDARRLALMGAVLAKAAERCQIIVFTCTPERYGNIGNARVVEM